MGKKKLTKLTILLASSLVAFTSCRNNSKGQLYNAGIIQDTKFNSCTVNITIADFTELGFNLGDSCDVKFSNGYELKDVPYYNGFYVKNAYPVIVAYPSSTNILITYNNTGIWDVAGLSEKDTVDICINTAKKYLETQETFGQSYAVSRDKYDSDEEFSNFRALKGGNLKDNLVFRGASPVDNSRNRAKITDELLEKNEIKSVVDLADTKENMEEYFTESGFSSKYTKNLYEEGKDILLGMGSSYSSLTYKESVVKGFNHMIETDGPYYIHCMEGKDRTGFVCALLEALMGATYDEMCEDYMLTYKNYYKITKEYTIQKYNAIVDLYFDAFMEELSGSTDKNVLKNSDYTIFAKNYLKEGGMSEEKINELIALLSK